MFTISKIDFVEPKHFVLPMATNDFTLVTITFEEHPHALRASADELVVMAGPKFTIERYCTALFKKVLTIGLSESTAFLDYQCSRVKNPFVWLNTLEKLIKLNVDHFSTNSLKHRHTKFISQIDIKRHELQVCKPKPMKKKKYLNGFTDDKEYSFPEVKEQLAHYQSTAEKIAFIEDQIIDYKQNPPHFLSVLQQPFDLQCQLEIDRLKKKEKLRLKSLTKDETTDQKAKIPVNTDIKTFCDVFFKLMNQKTSRGKPFITCTIKQATEMICNNFCEPDGSLLNPNTIRTYLSPSKPENRPKSDNEISLH